MRWWDRRTRKITRKISFDKPITSMELSSQTQRLVVASGNTVAFIPAQPAEFGTPTHTLNLPYAPSSASVHPIWQDRFVTGSTSDEWVRVHRINGEESEVLKGHHGPVHCVEYSPDGEVYASGSGAFKHVHNNRSLLAETFCRFLIFLFYLFMVRQRMVCTLSVWSVVLIQPCSGTIRFWQTTPGKTYGLWQGAASNGG
jgi:serine-threonine kinase receptor-associated protein